MCPIGYKKRDLIAKIRYGSITVQEGSSVTTTAQPYAYEQKGIQVTESEGHRKSRNGKYYEGGPFFTYRCEAKIPVRHVQLAEKSGARTYRYNGPISIPAGLMTMPSGVPSNDSSYLDPIGAEAIAAVDPLNPNAQTGAALGEILRDRRLPVPAIQSWRRRTAVARAAADEYLSAVFGWLPLVDDIQNTARSVRDGNTVISNYHGASGSNVGREFSFPTESSVTITTVSPNARATYHPLANVPAFNNGSGPLTRTRESTTRRWFSGAFTYKAAGDDSVVSNMLSKTSDANKLLGISLTPDLVWELTPWSWAIDWFSNAQDVIHNISSFELAGLIMRYGYIMEETSTIDTYTLPSTFLKGTTGTVPPATVVTTTKRRREANPFGFGLSWDGLSPTQLAITAALGITRLR